MILNRELSWLEFNRRVLMEMEDLTTPILERLRFSAIFASNLDEFFMVRVAAIKNQISSGYEDVDPTGLTAREKLELINETVSELVDLQYKMTMSQLETLREDGISLIRSAEFTQVY